jgi:hypothetical protein
MFENPKDVVFCVETCTSVNVSFGSLGKLDEVFNF